MVSERHDRRSVKENLIAWVNQILNEAPGEPVIDKPVIPIETSGKVIPEQYTRETALDELFIDSHLLEDILLQLENKKNIVLQGPPGVGKTFIARRLARLLMGEKNRERIEMIQFHQSYSYEDFMKGYHPNENGGFELKNGIFFDFCLMGQPDPDKPFVFCNR